MDDSKYVHGWDGITPRERIIDVGSEYLRCVYEQRINKRGGTVCTGYVQIDYERVKVYQRKGWRYWMTEAKFKSELSTLKTTNKIIDEFQKPATKGVNIYGVEDKVPFSYMDNWEPVKKIKADILDVYFGSEWDGHILLDGKKIRVYYDTASRKWRRRV